CDVADFVHRNVAQPRFAEQSGHVRAARAFGARGRRNRRQRRLAGERTFVGALDVVARGAHPLVRDEGVDRVGRHRPQTRPCAPSGKPALDLDVHPRNTNPMEERDLIYDWNGVNGGAAFDWTRARVDLNDETLRDGLQSPSVTDPSLDDK